LARALKKLDKYDVKFVPLRWGNTPQNQLDPSDEFGQWVLSNIITSLPQKPDVFVQVSVANEFQPRGHYNIGVTAGVETTIIPKDFVDGANRMDLIIVPSKFTKDVMVSTVYQEKNKQTDQIIGEHKIVKPVEVLFEGVNEEIFGKADGVISELDKLETEFNFLIVGHWLKGDLGQDRKDIGMSIKTIATVFQYLPKDKRPGIVIKTSTAGFSITDREMIKDRINAVLSPLGDKVIPVYLVHGDLSEGEMSALYHHPKIKAMVSFTKGEGYGRPLAEFALTGKPILVSKWSGLVDFLPEENTVYLDGTLNNVHPSAADQFLMKEAKWFTVNYSDAANKLFDVFNNYSQHLKRSAGLKGNILKNFTMEGMIKRMGEIMESYVKEQPKMMPLNLPKLNKIELPKLNKL
jgi:glycosyltransferase involved in cell wall biosynthesis